jgi:hypothetical protein
MVFVQMLTDVSKGQTPLVVSGKKEAQIAVKNSLMKKVFVHESMGKFIEFVQKDGSIEVSTLNSKPKSLDPNFNPMHQ